MLALLYGLGAAAIYGAADFVGGLMSRRVPPSTVVFLSQLFAVPLVLVSLPFGGGEPSVAALGWGVGAGVAGGIGVLFLYRGLSRGRMSVVAPITALAAAGLPVLYGIVRGERPSGLAIGGVVLGLASIWLISMAPAPAEGRASSSGVIDGLLAGAGFGVFFIVLDHAPGTSGMWPLLGTRAGSLAFVGALLIARKERLEATRPDLPGIAAAGLLDFGANILFVLATRTGLLAIAAVLTSLYPAGTVLLARVVLKEKLTPLQLVGLVVGAAGVVMIGLA